ncbi:probable transcriptional regulator protein, LysR family [Rhizobium etli CFN 42]|uniref:HTH-type transcriptional regulator TtuA n=1 Tax=Rhizobium etli (strain ATCC 51251 / DSM 11541 / JCM 21823 / NBRC 15573 / CFN 42) TaxID=347834 RepID=Q2KCM7_RHIEC|nr:LysR family transcriptional regulator [Rhizobium etli]ABC89409.1 probable transcriptional regulator protein, LysR family [Rhizobium etli CFN 42]
MKTLDPLDGIAAFLTVSTHLSFTKAAEELSMARATVGAQVRQLEDRLGIRLFQRSTRKVALTEAGAAYRQALSGILPQIREAERAAISFQKEAVGRLRVSAPPDLGHLVIVPAVSEFLKLNPAVSVELDLSHRPVNLVEDGFDLAIRGRLEVDINLITRQLATSSIVISASPAYIAEHGVPMTPHDLVHHACLHFAELRWGRIWPFSRDGEEFRIPIVPRLELNHSLGLRDAAVLGLGIVLLPDFVVGEDLRQGRLVRLLPDWDISTIQLQAVYPANRHIAVKVRRFVSFLAGKLRP